MPLRVAGGFCQQEDPSNPHRTPPKHVNRPLDAHRAFLMRAILRKFMPKRHACFSVYPLCSPLYLTRAETQPESGLGNLRIKTANICAGENQPTGLRFSSVTKVATGLFLEY